MELGASYGIAFGPQGVLIGGLFGAFAGGLIGGGLGRIFFERKTLSLSI